MRIVAAALFMLAAQAAEPAGLTPVEGRHYIPLPQPQPTLAGPGEVEVIEFFSWGCPHCYEAEPDLQRWLAGKPDNVVFRRVPAAFNPIFERMARAYVAADQMGVIERVNDPLYAALHDPKSRGALADAMEAVHRAEVQRDEAAVTKADAAAEAALAALFEKHAGVTKAKFLEFYRSPSVRTRIARYTAQLRAYQITGVPAFVVDGRYFVGGSEVRTETELVAATTALATREAAAKSKRAR
jgi:thiol:disulfide interchange protein DsbA